MTPLRFGLIGCGLWGAHHAKAIAQAPGAVLAAIAERSEEYRAAARAAHPDAEICDDYRQVIQRDDIDVIDCVLPSHLHYEVGKAALEAGKHVFLEKPMAVTIEHCDELVALAAKQGKVLAVDHELRLSALWGSVKRLIDEGAIGAPQYVLLELSRFPYRLGSEGWRFDIRRVGNWILEEPIHFFDLARWYLSVHGEPISVYARANSRQPDHPELQDNFSAIVNFRDGAYADGAYAVLTQTLAAFEHHVTCKVTGTSGAIWANWSAPDARSPVPTFGLRYTVGDEVREIPFREVTGEVVELNQQIAALVQAIRKGTPPPVSGVDGRWSVALCLLAQESVDRGRVVEIPSEGLTVG